MLSVTKFEKGSITITNTLSKLWLLFRQLSVFRLVQVCICIIDHFGKCVGSKCITRLLTQKQLGLIIEDVLVSACVTHTHRCHSLTKETRPSIVTQ